MKVQGQVTWRPARRDNQKDMELVGWLPINR